MLLLALLVAAALRFWQLGQAPPGLYRDEAYNGLDALRVLEGQHSLYFAANNGREPAYVYLAAAAVALFGRTALALRLAAALVGTLTTLVVYRLARTWFGRRVALLAAWLWAVTLWPVHLSRIAFRPILLAPLLALAFWLGTAAYGRRRRWLWLAAGAAYGAAFYTYLAIRFTPLLLLALLSYLLLSRRFLPAESPAQAATPGRRLWPGIFWFAASALIVVLPLALYAWQHPSLFLGRAQQVSIFNPDVRQGSLLPALLRQTGRTLGMFVWQGDTILRHNPGGRPLFDLTMVAPFLLGLLWCIRHRRRPPAMALLLWVGIMLGPTILAEDAPHFLRAAGILPAVVFFPAIGLSKIWEWPKLADALRKGLVLFLALGTLVATVADYVNYSRRSETAFFFEAAARELAQQIDDEPRRAAVYVDRRFWEGWPSLPFLVHRQQLTLFTTQAGLPEAAGAPAAIYAWPYDGLEAIVASVRPPALVAVQEGVLARGDLEADPYPLYVHYEVTDSPSPAALATFGEAVVLRDVVVAGRETGRLQVDLYWSAGTALGEQLRVFVHVLQDGQIVKQSDAPPGQGYWPVTAWQPGVVVRDRHVIDLEASDDPAQRQIAVGLYDPDTGERLPVMTPAGAPAGNSWLLPLEPVAHEEK